MRSMRKSLRLHAVAGALYLVLATLALAAPLAKNGLVFVVKSGTTTTGQPQYQVADSSDAGARNLWDKLQNAPEVLKAAAWYQSIYEQRKEQIRAELSRDGQLSASDQAILNDLPGPYPVYIEVKPGTGGAFNDWKGQFDLRYADGRVEHIAAPRIVFQANDPVAVGGDIGLLRQTVVHEIAHGAHAVMVGPSQTPTTPWLSRPHAGNSTTDSPLALIEGYAEFVGAHLTDRKTIAGDPANAVTNNLYVYGSDGKVKNAEDLWKTEGWAATVLYKIANGSGIDDGFEKINQTLTQRNPQDFKRFVEDFQELHPDDAPEVRSLISAASMGQIYAGSGQPAGQTATQGGGGGGVAAGGSNGGGGSFLDDLFEGPGGDGSGIGMGKIIAMVLGGALGAVVGISMGPIAIVALGAAGVAAGYFLGDYFMDSERQSDTYVGGAWARPYAAEESSSRVDDGPLPPTTPMAPTEVRSKLDQTYKRYLSALAANPATSEAVRLAREAYEAARSAYKASFGAAN